MPKISESDLRAVEKFYLSPTAEPKVKNLITVFLSNVFPQSAVQGTIRATPNLEPDTATALFQQLHNRELSPEEYTEFQHLMEKTPFPPEQGVLLTVFISNLQEALHKNIDIKLEDYIPEGSSENIQTKMRVIGKALVSHALTVPFQREHVECLEPLLDQRLEQAGLTESATVLKENLQECGVLSKKKGKKDNYRIVNLPKLESYIAGLSDDSQRMALRLVFNAFLFDLDPETSEAIAWQKAGHSDLGMRDHAIIAIHSDAAVGRSHWWAEEGAVEEAFKTRYGQTTGGLRRMPYTVFRNVAFAAKDLLNFLILSPKRLDAFKNYIDNPTPDHLEKMFKSGCTTAFFTAALDTACRLFVFNPNAVQEIKTLCTHQTKDNLVELLKKWPGLLTTSLVLLTWCVVEGTRFVIFNPSCRREYEALFNDPSFKNLQAFWNSNPGILGGLLMSGQAGARQLFRFLIFNPTADLSKLNPATSAEDNISRTFEVFQENPGLLFASVMIAEKYFLFNPSASKEYHQLLNDRSPANFKAFWKANPGLVGGALMTLEFALELGLRTLIWNPAAKVTKHLAPQTSQEDSISNTLAVFKENPGLLFAVVAIAGKYFGFNPAASKEYRDLREEHSLENLKAFWQANPGLVGGALMTLEFALELGLRTLIWNPAAEVKKYLAPQTSQEDSIVNTLAVFKENPGLLFAVAAIAGKYFGFNPAASEEYDALLKERSLENLKAFWQANPGLVGGALMSLEFAFEWGLRSLIWNPAAEVGKHLVPSRELDSISNTLAVFKENPGLLFAVAAIAGKYFGFNPVASQEYSNLLDDRSPANFQAFWKANPGLVGGALMSLEFAFEWGLRSLIWNPAAEVGKHLVPPRGDDSVSNTLAVFKENPGLLFAVTAIAGKYFGFNPVASKEYGTLLKERSLENLKAFWQANPGLVGGALMSLEFALELGLRSLIWNPAAEVGKHLSPPTSEKDSILNTLAVFKENPGLLFAVAAIAGKYFGFNPVASKEYRALIENRSGANFEAFWKTNPGLIGGVLMTLEYAFELGVLRALIWNPMAEVKEHLLPIKSKDDSIANTLAVFKKNPGLLFAVAAIAGKYFGFNPVASQEYSNLLNDCSPANFQAFWKANPGLVGGALMSLEFAFEWGLRSLIWNPAAEVGKHLVPSREADSVSNTLAVFKENPGLLFAVAAIAGKYFGFNPVASKEYGTLLKERSLENLKAFWQANPGLVGGALMSLEFAFEWGLRSLIWNPAAEVGKYLVPSREDDSVSNTLAVFKENPGLLFAVAAIAGKYFGFNPVASKEYSNLLEDRSPANFQAFWKANPGLVGGALMSLEFAFEWGLRSLIWNPAAEVKKHLAPQTSQEDSIVNTLAVFKENPGLLFAVAAIAGKYFGFNPAASEEYDALLKERSLENLKALWKANPGLVGGALLSLEFALELGLRSLIWNPAAEVGKHLSPPTSEEDSIVNTLAVFKENPGLLFAVVAIAGKYFGFNPAASQEYTNLIEDRSFSNLKTLWKANPGLVGGALISLEFALELGLRSLIWNPSADSAKHLAPPNSRDDSIQNTFAVFKENPGLVFATAAIAGKYIGLNPSALEKYRAYLQDRSLTHFSELWKANPGLIGGGVIAIELILEWSLRTLVWNPQFAAKEFMFAQESGLHNIGLVEVGKLSDRWPGFLYGTVLLAVKYGIVNFSARDEYLRAFKTVGGAAELTALFKRSPGIAACTLFVVLKLFEELGAKVIFDPRLDAYYKKFWEDPSTKSAVDLFQSGLVGATLYSIGKGIETIWAKRSEIADVLETKTYEGPARA